MGLVVGKRAPRRGGPPNLNEAARTGRRRDAKGRRKGGREGRHSCRHVLINSSTMTAIPLLPRELIHLVLCEAFWRPPATPATPTAEILAHGWYRGLVGLLAVNSAFLAFCEPLFYSTITMLTDDDWRLFLGSDHGILVHGAAGARRAALVRELVLHEQALPPVRNSRTLKPQTGEDRDRYISRIRTDVFSNLDHICLLHSTEYNAEGAQNKTRAHTRELRTTQLIQAEIIGNDWLVQLPGFEFDLPKSRKDWSQEDCQIATRNLALVVASSVDEHRGRLVTALFRSALPRVISLCPCSWFRYMNTLQLLHWDNDVLEPSRCRVLLTGAEHEIRVFTEALSHSDHQRFYAAPGTGPSDGELEPEEMLELKWIKRAFPNARHLRMACTLSSSRSLSFLTLNPRGACKP